MWSNAIIFEIQNKLQYHWNGQHNNKRDYYGFNTCSINLTVDSMCAVPTDKQLPKTCNNVPNFADFQPPATAKR
jgi:hypothetical protein